MATPAYEWASRSSPLHQRSAPVFRAPSPAARSSPVPDTPSHVYPERLIRPLPKRRLRDRLSLEDNETLAFPSVPSNNTSLFSFPYASTARGPSTAESPREARGVSHHEGTCETCNHEHSEGEIEEEDEGRAGSIPYSPDAAVRGGGQSKPVRRAIKAPPPPGSTASSVDGYESFENTNNKKKRKIPQSNGLGGHGHHAGLSADLANMGISAREGDAPAGIPRRAGDETERTVGSYYGTGSAVSGSSPSGTGISGAGRGRYGRSGRGSLDRRPLGTSMNGGNASGPGRARASLMGRKDSPAATPQSDAGDKGIISAAIATAKQQASPQTPSGKGSETSLLHEQASKTPPQKTDFTFTCGSDSTNKVVWPGQQANAPMPNPNMPRRAPGPNPNGAAPPHPNSGPAQQQQQQQQGKPQTTKKPHPRRPGREYERAARQRRLQQEYSVYHHPPRREDVWICEFCEYEAIFGEPPLALIRQYEKKDRKEQKKLAEKRRLLEKAKMKGRKGKKGTKATKAAQQAAEFQKREMQRADAARQQQQAAPNHQGHPLDPQQQQDMYEGQDLDEEEYYEDEYGDTEEFDPPDDHSNEYPPEMGHPTRSMPHRRQNSVDVISGKGGNGKAWTTPPPTAPSGTVVARS